jgi:hypothetical protein
MYIHALYFNIHYCSCISVCTYMLCISTFTTVLALVYVHTCIRKCIHTHTNACMLTCIHVCNTWLQECDFLHRSVPTIRTYIHTYIHTYTNVHRWSSFSWMNYNEDENVYTVSFGSYTHLLKARHFQACMHSCMRTCIRACMRSNMYACSSVKQ